MSKPWRETLKRQLPFVVPAARSVRLIRNQARFPVVNSYLDWHRTIVGGPFQGVRYTHSGIVLLSEMLGTYEQCLIPLIEAVIRRQPALIVDVGAAYGYYAVGLAVTCPASTIIAYELDPSRVAVIEKCRRLNHISADRLQVRGCAVVNDLAADLANVADGFLFMDVEGVEDVLLRPDLVPGLRHVEIIVELHETIVPGITQRLHERFTATHEATLIQQAPVTQQPLAVPSWIGRRLNRHWHRMSGETREPTMSWMHLTPRP